MIMKYYDIAIVELIMVGSERVRLKDLFRSSTLFVRPSTTVHSPPLTVLFLCNTNNQAQAKDSGIGTKTMRLQY